jgi:two-component system, sensor histidine kinase and response regulator
MSLRTLLPDRAAVILLIDDQEANVRLVGTLLTQHGCEVIPALSGDQGLQRAQARTPDLVLLDMMMPGMDGFEVLRRLRADPVLAGVPVVFLTAASERAALVRAFDLGAVDYVTKPFVAEELLARVRTHLELKLTRDHLRRVASEREELASIVAHDIKNPLSTISFSAQLLRGQNDDPERRAKLADLIQKCADNAMAFIHSYLERRAEGELLRRFAAEPVDLNETARHVVDMMNVPAQAKNVALQMTNDKDAVATGDAMAIEHVLENLVANAIKFSPPGGEILVHVGGGSPGMVRVCVMDRGPGVSRDDQRKLFQRFVRLTAQPTGGESSTGLGLALAKQDVSQMRGELWYEDRHGGGASFNVELPRAAAAPTVTTR